MTASGRAGGRCEKAQNYRHYVMSESKKEVTTTMAVFVLNVLPLSFSQNPPDCSTNFLKKNLPWFSIVRSIVYLWITSNLEYFIFPLFFSLRALMVNISKTWISQWSVKHIKVQIAILVMQHMVMFLSYNEVIPKQPTYLEHSQKPSHGYYSPIGCYKDSLYVCHYSLRQGADWRIICHNKKPQVQLGKKPILE